MTTSKLITGGKAHPFLPQLSQAISQADEIEMTVAFIKSSGLRLLFRDLQDALARDNPVQLSILTSDYLDVTDPEALRMLMLLQAEGASIRVYVTDKQSFHMKAYLFTYSRDGQPHGTAFIGSSNISHQALTDGLEWNYRIDHPADAGFLEARAQFEALFTHPNTIELSDEWITAYEARRKPIQLPATISALAEADDPAPNPTPIQQEGLKALVETRQAGFQRGLVVLATGLGKTWLAAFDAQQSLAKRVLFVAHREEILTQAATTFLRIRPSASIGFFMGKKRDTEVEVLCASIQTLGRQTHLNQFTRGHFDYIVVDEFHHAAAPMYRRLLNHFTPKFLLGLTATPDRTDQSDILALCDDNLVFERNLFEGIESKLLAPFAYYGILDESVDYREIPWRNGQFDPNELSTKLATKARATHALSEWRRRAQKRTLAFCVSRKHADFMAAEFNQASIKAAAVYAGSDMSRGEALQQLADGTLTIIFSVDLFNEGVDLPLIDTVMMLRPTESKILFLQQLGRGLRLAEGKSQLVVLDFIANHKSFLHKPQALAGLGSALKDLSEFANRLESGTLNLPEGCFINYDLSFINFLKSLTSNGLADDYTNLRDILGRRPTLTEFYRAGNSLAQLRKQYGHWFGLVATMGDLDESEKVLVTAEMGFLQEVETTSMAKSFKMVLLEAFQSLSGWTQGVALSALAQLSWEILHRNPTLLADLPEDKRNISSTDAAWLSYWKKNPVKAWIGGNLSDASKAFFSIDDAIFISKLKIAPEAAERLGNLIQELIDFRLASYEALLAKLPDTAQVIPFVSPKQKQFIEIPYFDDLKIACGHFRTSTSDVMQHMAIPSSYGQLDPARHFIARASGNSMNGGKHPIKDGDYLLLELVTSNNAGSNNGHTIAIERQDEYGDNQYLLRVIHRVSAGNYLLRANNPDYPDLPATESMRTLARLKAVIDPLDLGIGH